MYSNPNRPALQLSVRWNYAHRLDYYRETGQYERDLIYAEHVQDHGFCFSAKGITRTQWYEHYTRICALDFLGRRHAPAGVYLVTTTRYLPFHETITLCTIRLRWPDDTSQAVSTDSPSDTEKGRPQP